MTSRPTDLPDYASPPVSEVSLGVQFNILEGLLAPHLGLIWTEFKAEFPLMEQHSPLEPVFETFGEKGASVMPLPRIVFPIPTPRLFFINKGRTELLQVQRDRFYHNWRKIGDGDEYPRFESMLNTFENGLRRLDNLVRTEGLGSTVPNQCEVIYVNYIPVPQDARAAEVLGTVLGSWVKAPSLKGLGAPEDARVLVRYVIRQPDEVPIGRLIISAEPAWKLDGTHVLQLTLVARGKPKGESLADVAEFLKLGRRHIVKGFDELTSKEMHKVWGRKQ
jgi:uncharacterized protein (TIGR04255 family)